MVTVDGHTPRSDYIKFQPLTPTEIDNHPDGGRIWATLVSLEERHSEVWHEAFDEGYKTAEKHYTFGSDD